MSLLFLFTPQPRDTTHIMRTRQSLVLITTLFCTFPCSYSASPVTETLAERSTFYAGITCSVGGAIALLISIALHAKNQERLKVCDLSERGTYLRRTKNCQRATIVSMLITGCGLSICAAHWVAKVMLEQLAEQRTQSNQRIAALTSKERSLQSQCQNLQQQLAQSQSDIAAPVTQAHALKATAAQLAATEAELAATLRTLAQVEHDFQTYQDNIKRATTIPDKTALSPAARLEADNEFIEGIIARLDPTRDADQIAVHHADIAKRNELIQRVRTQAVTATPPTPDAPPTSFYTTGATPHHDRQYRGHHGGTGAAMSPAFLGMSPISRATPDSTLHSVKNGYTGGFSRDNTWDATPVPAKLTFSPDTPGNVSSPAVVPGTI